MEPIFHTAQSGHLLRIFLASLINLWGVSICRTVMKKNNGKTEKWSNFIPVVWGQHRPEYPFCPNARWIGMDTKLNEN